MRTNQWIIVQRLAYIEEESVTNACEDQDRLIKIQ